jgi:hypothetical protein
LTRAVVAARIRTIRDKEHRMTQLPARFAWVRILKFSAVLAVAVALPILSNAADDAAVKDADSSFVMALAKRDKSKISKALDAQLTWTTSAGDTFGRAKALATLPMPALGDESGAAVDERSYGSDVAAVQASKDKVHVLRIWAKRAEGWRLLVYQEVTQRSGAAPPPQATTNDCENPCKGVPYTAKDDAERGIIKSWAELETAVLHHDAKNWTPHVLDDFVLISSGSAEPADKAFRLKQLNTPGFGPAPPQLAKSPAARFIHFGDTVVMIAQANPYAGKPNHITRIWVKGPETWQMAFSYQTTIQSAPAIVPPKS